MPPSSSPSQHNHQHPHNPKKPRLILYYQTHNNPPITSLVQYDPPLVTHIILAALHLNHPAGNIHLNDHPPSHPIHTQTWSEIRSAQSAGIKCLILLGGAAQGSFTRLDDSQESFEEYYSPLKDFLIWSGLDGVDLDVEEYFSLSGMVRLVLQLRQDFGQDFIITAAPVASAMLEECGPEIDFEKGRRKEESWEKQLGRLRVGNMSGFSYQHLEKAVGKEIAWYNCQFYCGWGSLRDQGKMYEEILERGRWKAEKIVVGTVTNPTNGAGWTSDRLWRRAIERMVKTAQGKGGQFAGIMGWEWFNAVVARQDRGFQLREGEPWLWATRMRELMDTAISDHAEMGVLDESWDETAALWTGRFKETGFGGKSVVLQNGRGRWL